MRILNHFYPHIITGILCVLFMTNCSSDDVTNNSIIPGNSSFELEKFDPVPISKTNSTKTYMHYMTWFESDESSANNQWGYHWTMSNKNPNNIDGNGKREIASHYYPLIGPYHSGDKDVIEYHLLLLKYAGVDGLLIDWYGTYDVNDYAMIKENTNQVIDLLDEVGIDYAIVYEDRFLNNIVDAGLESTEINAAKNDMRYLQSNYFSDSNYIKINSKPLLLNFGPIRLQTQSDWTDVFSVFNTKPSFLTLWYESSDAGSNAQGEYSWVYEDNSHLTNFYANSLPNLDIAIGSAYPGFKDFYAEGGGGSNIGWIIEHNNGATLNETFQLANNSNLDYLQLITWNDFGEGTMFEPTQEFGFSYVEKTKEFTGATNTVNVFQSIHQLYQLRKEYKNNSSIQKKLDQVFYYFVSLQTSKANELINSIE